MQQGEPSQILCVMNLPPDLAGHGGSQRAWKLVEALRPHGSIHFVLIYNDHDRVCIETSLAPLERLVASITRINVEEWRGRKGKVLKFLHPQTVDVLRIRSHAAPRFSKATLASIAVRLPLRNPDLIFAGRLPTAVIVQDLIDRNLLSAKRRIVDFDDVLSKFRLRQLQHTGVTMGHQGRLLCQMDAYLLARAERRIGDGWDGVGVCSDEDAIELGKTYRDTAVVKIPNIVGHDVLPPRVPDGHLRCLFVGNLSFPPNAHGLHAFVETAWPIVLQAVPEATLAVVGFNPSAKTVAFGHQPSITVHANVPDVRPFYEACDVVVVPILFGGGTRVKIVEAMAYGRPVVSTTLGAEGLDLEDGRHLLLVEAMEDFAAALAKLAQSSVLRQSLVDEARLFQERQFGPMAIMSTVRTLVEPTIRSLS